MPFDPDASKKDVERFVSGYLKTDGLFILRMINSHAGIIFGTDLVLSLWQAFYGIEEEFRRRNSQELTPSPVYEQEKNGKLKFIKAPQYDIKQAMRDYLVPQSTAIAKMVLPLDASGTEKAGSQDDAGSEGDLDSGGGSNSTGGSDSLMHGGSLGSRGRQGARSMEEGKGIRARPSRAQSVPQKKTVV